ncbi:MAG: nucleoside deaminase [Fibrobacterota bacterium]
MNERMTVFNIMVMGKKPTNDFMAEAVTLSLRGMHSGKGGPFGCVVVKNGKIVGRGENRVTSTNDPTAHAEVTAIRDACRRLKSFQLTGCDVYTSCEPCPMCLAALYWARPRHVYYANTRNDAAKIGFDDAFIYNEIAKPLSKRKMKLIRLKTPGALLPFTAWTRMEHKIEY